MYVDEEITGIIPPFTTPTLSILPLIPDGAADAGSDGELLMLASVWGECYRSSWLVLTSQGERGRHLNFEVREE